MADPKPAKKVVPPQVRSPQPQPQPQARPEVKPEPPRMEVKPPEPKPEPRPEPRAEAKPPAPPKVQAKAPVPAPAPPVETKRAPHELFWEAGQSFYQALQKGQEEAQNRFAAAYRDEQQRLWKLQLDASRRADELRHDFWNTLNQAAGEDFNQVYQDAAQRYHDALCEIQTNLQKEWENAGASYEKFLASLQESFEASRITAFNAYKHACRKAWTEIDPNTLTCESLATIGQSLFAGATVVGGQPYGA